MESSNIAQEGGPENSKRIVYMCAWMAASDRRERLQKQATAPPSSGGAISGVGPAGAGLHPRLCGGHKLPPHAEQLLANDGR